MRNISIYQVIILIFFSILIFSDFSYLKKQIHEFIKKLLNKLGKKGVEPLPFGFGNHYSTTELFS